MKRTTWKLAWAGLCKIACIVFFVSALCIVGYGQSPTPALSKKQITALNNELGAAIRARDEARVEQAIAKGANPRFGIIVATGQKDAQMIELLLAKGAKPNSGLYAAVRQKDKQMVELFLSKGADPSYGLYQAIDQDDVQMVEFLLSKGAKPYSRLISLAEKKGNQAIKNMLIEQRQKNPAAIQSRDKAREEQTTAKGAGLVQFREAVKQKDYQMVEQLIAKGARPDYGLLTAIRQKDKQMVELLLSKGASLSFGLHGAVDNDNVQMVEFLLSKGAKPHSRLISLAEKKGNQTIKNMLIEQTERNAVQEKIDKGMPTDYESQKKYGQLLIAHKKIKEFEDFIKNDHCKMRNEDYAEFIAEAAFYGCLDVAKFLFQVLNSDTDLREAYFRVMARGNKEFFDYLIAQNIAFDWNSYGQDAVILTAAGGSVEIMDFLKRKGIPLDNVVHSKRIGLLNSPYHDSRSEFHHYTALSVAAYQGHLKLVQYLIENGADVNKIIGDMIMFPSENEYDALISAANGGKTEVCLYLISKGANPNFIVGGENSVLIAKRQGFPQCAEALIKAGGVSNDFEIRKLRKAQTDRRKAAEKAASDAASRRLYERINANYQKASREEKMAWEILKKWFPMTVVDVKLTGGAGYYSGLTTIRVLGQEADRKISMRIVKGKAIVTLYDEKTGAPLTPFTENGPM